MTINKFQGKTEDEAINRAKLEFGDDAVIMNVRELKAKGPLAFLKNPTFEVTAAVRERETNFAPRLQKAQQQPTVFDYKADETLDVSKLEEEGYAPQRRKIPPVQRVTPIDTPDPEEKETEAVPAQKQVRYTLAEKEDRQDDISERIDEKLAEQKAEKKPQTSESLNFVRALYTTLLKNEVNERYINMVMEEAERYIRPGNNLDLILSNVYQKLILQFGQPHTIEVGTERPKVVFFIGPTGVGKTTTIAKIASKYKMEYGKKVAFVTADTYRIAAPEQLQVYANIIEAPMEIVYSAQEMNEKLSDFAGYDLIFVDTAGFSHRNISQRNDVKELINGLDEKVPREIYLVLSATTKYNDLLEIVDVYRDIADYKLIFTKLDETTTYGNMLNVRLYSQADLSYVTTGQNVPDDIEVFDTQKIVKRLLGGHK
ncbi:MAG: flagellar biosynthesis protein FlhF [Clostridiales bacterium]|nr:flagellar biosynthesis protein FlhF [Clostridiales bacterium]